MLTFLRSQRSFARETLSFQRIKRRKCQKALKLESHYFGNRLSVHPYNIKTETRSGKRLSPRLVRNAVGGCTISGFQLFKAGDRKKKTQRLKQHVVPVMIKLISISLSVIITRLILKIYKI